ncbi:MAG: hypothetical protein QOF78_3596, partial [Phycisphaerales bacterium]|nr:hypothetical protein [Phycisphaerales bacterium]
MSNRSRSRALGTRPRRIVLAVSEVLESRRLMASPQVSLPTQPLPEDDIQSPNGHFYFEDAPGQALNVAFNQSVTLASGAMSLTNLTTAETVTELTQSGSGATRTWTVGETIDGQGMLTRGNYELLLNADLVTNAGNENLDGDSNGTGGDDYISGFFFQPGDANHDRLVSGDDYSSIDFNSTIPGANGFHNGDFNYDGIISGDDWATIDFWAGTALPAPPDQPNEMTAAAGRGFIDLTWTAPTDVDVDGFKIYRSLDAGDTFTLHHTIADPTARAWRDEGLEDGTKYTYRIRAYSDSDGQSLTTNKIWSVTNLPSPLEQPIVSAVTYDALTLTWNDNTTNESGFEIEQTGAGGAITIISVPAQDNPDGTASFRVTGLNAATTYSFRVRAYITGTQDSAWSPTVAAATFPTTPDVTLGISGASAVNEGSEYSLDIDIGGIDSSYVTAVELNWGDGASETLSSFVTRAAHTYPDGEAPRTITATAKAGNTVLASDMLELIVHNVVPMLT